MPNCWNTYFLFSCLQDAKRQLPEYVYGRACLTGRISPVPARNKKLVGYGQRYFLIWGEIAKKLAGWADFSGS